MSKVRIWEDSHINSAIKHAIQIKEHIEHLAQQQQPLPQSLVPSDLLYNMVTSFYILYQDALERDLIETGTNPATLKNNIH
jgi:hypothetical protein